MDLPKAITCSGCGKLMEGSRPNDCTMHDGLPPERIEMLSSARRYFHEWRGCVGHLIFPDGVHYQVVDVGPPATPEQPHYSLYEWRQTTSLQLPRPAVNPDARITGILETL